MSGPILVVRIAGTPFTLNDLRPDTQLLSLSQALAQPGRQVTATDLANFETLEMLYPQDTQSELYDWALKQPQENAASLFQSEAAPKIELPTRIRKRQSAVFEQLGDRLVARVEPSAVCFHVHGAKDLAPTLLAAQRVRAMRPRTRIVAFGSAFRDENILNKGVYAFDAVVLGDAFSTGQLLDTPDRRAWRGIPNLAYLDGARFTLTRGDIAVNRFPESVLNLEKILYTTPPAYSKIRVFDIFAVSSGVGSSSMEPDVPVRIVGTEYLDSVRGLIEKFNTRAFCFRGADWTQSTEIERTLLSTGTRICYATTLDPANTARTKLGILAASGCAAVDIPVHSGSQRLIDTYYQRDFTVTQVERLTRAARFAGLYTSMHFTFPSAEDDYHTEDESLRLVRRANPSSAVLSPERASDSAHTGILSHEFGPLRGRARAKARRQCMEMGRKIRELNVTLNVDAGTALVAGLAGHRGREYAFVEMVGLQLLSGDTTGLAEVIEHVNDAAARPSRIGAFKPMALIHNAVAN